MRKCEGALIFGGIGAVLNGASALLHIYGPAEAQPIFHAIQLVSLVGIVIFITAAVHVYND